MKIKIIIALLVGIGWGCGQVYMQRQQDRATHEQIQREFDGYDSCADSLKAELSGVVRVGNTAGVAAITDAIQGCNRFWFQGRP